jgi:hypothetical protein
MKLLEGHVVEPGRNDLEADDQIAELEAEVNELRTALRIAKAETSQVRQDTARALAKLRRQLSPLHRALKAVFGELDAAGIEEVAPTGAAASSSDKWDAWKQRLGPGCAKVIDALLLGGEMNVRAIMVAAKMGENTVYQATAKMGQAGIIQKNGGKFSLKSL